MLRIAVMLLSAGLCAAPAFTQSSKLDELLDAGHYKQVRRTLDSSKNQDAETLYLLSKIKGAFHEHDEALRLAEAAVKANPNKAAYHLQLADVLSQDIDKVSLFKKMSLGSRIHSEIETAYKLEPKNTDCMWGMMRYYEQAPGIAGGSKEKAHQMAEEIGRINASTGYMAQAELARTEKQTEKLEELYLNAVKADPKNISALVSLAGFYGSDAQKKYDLAERYAKQALDLDPSRTAPYSVSAQIAAVRQNWDKIDVWLSQSEQANHDDLNAFYQAGRTLLQLNQELGRAERYLRKYLSQEPEGLTPTLAAAHWRLALVLEKLGRKPEAVKELEESLRLQPDFENAKKDLKRLKG